MNIVYTSRTGNVQKLIDRLGIDAVKITDGTEKVDNDYILITYTDGVGIIPKTVEKFIEANKNGLKAAFVSGNSERHPDSFCGAADKLAEKYGVEIITRFEKDGDESVENAVKALL